MESAVEKLGCTEFVIDMSIDDDVHNVLDEASWVGKLSKNRNIATSSFNAACIVMPGVTFNDAYRTMEEGPCRSRILTPRMSSHLEVFMRTRCGRTMSLPCNP